ncbi:MAG: hypothetical protein GF333_07110 [Candidatus Omnitrophica bacterium]|nr:hypothetical protein [Candidatus Omnitrophota bacterium]
MNILRALLILVLWTGCASTNAIYQRMGTVDCADGVSREEAVLLAQNHIIETPYKYRYRVAAPAIEELSEKNAWLIRFYGKKTNISEFYRPSVYEVTIDKRDGTCTVTYINNRNAPREKNLVY